MGRIRILPEDLAGRIAAGEVVERPASIVRELLDNSIDAGAERVLVSLEQGGKDLIRVSDDGMGMEREDLLLSVERHATSKITDFSDLFSIRTLGFRGEALPSVAAVSRLEILSKPAGAIVGQRLRIAGGKFLSIEETGAPEGTSVEVRDLFFNTPARRAFLRSQRSETQAVLDHVSRAALPWLSTHFDVRERDRILLLLRKSVRIEDRLTALLGEEIAGAMLSLEERDGPAALRLYLAPPDMARSRADRILVYVNNRHVRDRLVTKALLEGYGQRLMRGTYPQAVLLFDLDPRDLDVNVHPSKQEIRFQDGTRLFGMVRKAVKRAFDPPPPRGGPPSGMPAGRETEAPPLFLGLLESGNAYRGPMEASEAPVVQAPEEGGRIPEAFQVLGQLARTYILLEVGGGLAIVDQHAAHERILYERLRGAWERTAVASQQLLLPMQIDLRGPLAQVAEERREDLLRLGFDLLPFGGNSFLIRGVPADLGDAAWARCVPEVLEGIEDPDPSGMEGRERVLKVMACHGAIRAGASLREEEMTALIEELRQTRLPTHCPHGRPLVRHLGLRELEKWFRRVA